MISALAITFGPTFQTRLKEYWPNITYGLTAMNEPELFKKAVATVGDLGRSYEFKFLEHGPATPNKLFELVNSNLLNRDQRICVLYCIGDLFLCLK